MRSGWHDDGLTVDDLGPGWEATERALSDIQADLSRTVADAPALLLLWRNADPVQDSTEFEAPDGRWAYVGKARDWYFGANGGFALPRDYAMALLAIASDVADAIVDGLLGHHDYWPQCPNDNYILEVDTDSEQRCWWSCQSGDHVVAEVGLLSGSAS